MYKQKVVLGVAPTKRSFLSMEEAKRQKDKFMARIRAIKPEAVEIIDVDELCENGIMLQGHSRYQLWYGGQGMNAPIAMKSGEEIPNAACSQRPRYSDGME